jgi:hypothetical protein
MKKFFAVIAFAVPFLAFGQSSTVCYRATAEVPKMVPKVVCLEKISENIQAGKIFIDSSSHTLPYTAEIKSLSRHTEDRLNFVAEIEYANWDDRATHCGPAQDIRMIISGQKEAEQINPAALSIKVEVMESNDACHSENSETIAYKLVK